LAEQVDRLGDGGCRNHGCGLQQALGAADRRGVGDPDDTDARAVEIGVRPERGLLAHEAGALGEKEGRPEIDALPALLIDRHEGHVDSARLGRIRQLAGIRHDHELDRHLQLCGERFAEIHGHSVRPAIALQDHEERRGGGRKHHADPQPAGGRDLLFGSALVDHTGVPCVMVLVLPCCDRRR
jgi:hypothetical protein